MKPGTCAMKKEQQWDNSIDTVRKGRLLRYREGMFRGISESYDGVFLAPFEVICQMLNCVRGVLDVSCEEGVDYVKAFFLKISEEDWLEIGIVGQDMYELGHGAGS